LLVDIKIHSAFKDLFLNTELKADIKTYADIPLYLGSMHPKFRNYANYISQGMCEEGYAFLDKNLTIITEEDLFIKKAKAGDTFYIVPAIIGGGGKRTRQLLTFAAVAAGGYFLLSGAAAGAAGSAAAAGGTGGLFGGGFATTLGVNIGLALVTSMFTKREKIKEVDQNIRQNDMFGGLVNTINSGTPIPLIYGLHRVAGQLISGYLDTVDHGKDDTITVQSRFST